MDISEEVQKKIPYMFLAGKFKKYFVTNININTNEKNQYNFNGHKHCYYFKKWFFLLKNSVFFSFIAMDPIFKNRFDLEKKYDIMHTKLFYRLWMSAVIVTFSNVGIVWNFHLNVEHAR